MVVYFGRTAFDCDGIGFDKDGTLIDRSALWWGLYETRAALIRERHKEATVRIWTRMEGVDPFRRTIDLQGPLALASLGEEQVILAVAIYLTDRLSWNKAYQQALNILAEADRRLPPTAYAIALSGVPQVLLELAARRLPLAVLTQDQMTRTQDTLRRLGLESAVNCVVCPDNVRHAKPAPDMILHAAQQLGVEPGRMAVVGDAIVDLEMARAAGAFPVAVLNCEGSSREVDDLAGAVIQSVAEITMARPEALNSDASEVQTHITPGAYTPPTR